MCPHCGRAAGRAAGPPTLPTSGLSPARSAGPNAGTPPAAGRPADPLDLVETVPPAAGGATSKTVVAAVLPDSGGGPADLLAPAQGPDEIGRLGPYRVLKALGAGGMGFVFLAEDVGLRRRVALKAMLPEVAAHAANRQRFLREARLAAAVESDHVVRVYQVGEDRGVPFLAMELLKGEPLDRRLRSGPVPPAEVLRIGREVAEGLAAAHAGGLIHRDIKPANVWLEAPHGRVKILDFGLARAEGDATRLTETGVVLGTPAFMAPEQAAGQPVDARCDLFSLGAVLYLLSTGRRPFTGEGTLSTLVAVATETPSPPREVNPAVPAGLSDLIMRLLAKDPTGRPQTAKAVVDALRALEAAPAAPRTPNTTAALPRRAEPVPEAVPARRPGRRPLIAGVAAAVLAATGAVALVALRGGGGRSPPPPAPAGGDQPEEVAREEADGSLSPFALVSRPAALPGVRGWTLETRAHRGGVQRAAYSPASRLLATGGQDGTVRLLEPDGGALRRILVGHAGAVTALAWSPDGTALASGGADRTIRIWDAAAGRPRHTLRGHRAAVRNLAWSPDGTLLASGSDDETARLWEAGPGRQVRAFGRHSDPVVGAAWLPDGRGVASTSYGKGGRLVRVWDAATGAALHSHAPGGVAWWSAEHAVVVYAPGNKSVKFWDPVSDRVLRALTLREHNGEVASLALSPDGKTLATGGDRTVQFWDARSGQLRRTSKPGHKGRVHSVAWSPDGTALASSGVSDGFVALWKPDAEAPLRTLTQRGVTNLGAVTWAPDGSHIRAANNRTSALWDPATGKALSRVPWQLAGSSDLTWSPDGKTLATSNPRDGGVRLWDAASGNPLRQLVKPAGVDRWLKVAWSPDGKTLAVQGGYGADLWDVAAGTSRPLGKHANTVSALVWSPDGARLATAAVGNSVRLWDAAKAELLRPEFRSRWSSDGALAWSPDGRRFAVGRETGLEVWDAAGGDKPRLLPLAEGGVTAVAWAPGGARVATGGSDGAVRVWDVRSGKPAAAHLTGHRGKVHAVAWLAGGASFLTLGEEDRAVALWRADPLERVWARPAGTGAGRFSPDGRLLASRNDGTAVRIWDVETGRPRLALLTLPLGHADVWAAVGPDGGYRGPPQAAPELVYVIQTDAGQELVEPEAFARRYPAANGPGRAGPAGP
jgi:WD40 repeat protein/tRNA A-37 threonylcarbamoyl transferase component Bud32